MHIVLKLLGAALLAYAILHCKSMPKQGDVPVTMPQVREGTQVPEKKAPTPEPIVAKRAAPAMEDGEMEIAVKPSLNFRASPGLGGKIIDSIPYGTKIAVLDRGDDEGSAKKRRSRWYKIQYRGKTGYVNSKYLRESGDQRVITAKRTYNTKRRKRKTKSG
ncbi:MAG: SH3 domain-containing protein [Turneriella sp.]